MKNFKEILSVSLISILTIYAFFTILGFLGQIDTGTIEGGLSLVEYIKEQIEWFKLIRIF